ncbi:MFS transporter [Thiotrichales bacterium 19S3-7]|nr:MFS transporter [Thiotrichales bacterium 19S3-7]MCF6802922.1 MFS transporter [Thiotrichales bacterium 19S3-11]
MVLPLLPEIFYNKHNGLLIGWSAHEFYYGLVIFLAGFGTFLGMPIMGAIADNIGEKKTLLIGISLLCFSSLIAIISLRYNLLILFLMSRLIYSFAAGNYSVVNSLTVKLNSNVERSLVFRFPILAFLLGLTLGPVIGGYIIYWLNSFIYPFILLFLLGLFNFVMILAVLKIKGTNNKRHHQGNKVAILNKFKSIFYIFTKKNILMVVVVFVIISCAQGIYTQSIAIVLSQSLHYDVKMISNFFTTMAAATMISVLYIQLKVNNIFKTIYQRILLSLAILSFMFLILTFFIYVKLILWAVFIIIFIVSSILTTNYYALISLKTVNNEQGRIFGGIGQVQYIGYMFGGVVIGVSDHISTSFLTLIPLALFCLAFLCVLIITLYTSEMTTGGNT